MEFNHFCFTFGCTEELLLFIKHCSLDNGHSSYECDTLIRLFYSLLVWIYSFGASVAAATRFLLLLLLRITVFCDVAFSLPQLFVNIGISQIHMDVRRLLATTAACLHTFYFIKQLKIYVQQLFTNTRATAVKANQLLALSHSCIYFSVTYTHTHAHILSVSMRREKMGKITLTYMNEERVSHTYVHGSERLWIEFIFGRIYICSKPYLKRGECVQEKELKC